MLFHSHAMADEVPGLAKPWQLGLTPPASPVMEQLYTAHNYLLILITIISLFVLVLIIYICVRFSRKSNPNPSKTAHNTKLEIIWTVVPVLILIAIAIPSLRLHYFIEDDVEADMTLKVVGYQWYWHYEYPDHGGFGFDSYMKKQGDLQEGDVRNLSVDNRVVVPVNTKVKVLLTAGDVIHAWAVPAFGVKRDAVPGRLNSSWFKATKTGTYYGQCSELCGVGHGFMPIRVDVVEKDEFDTWVAAQQKEAGIDPESLKDSSAVEQEVPLTEPVEAEKGKGTEAVQEEKEKPKSESGAKKENAEQTVKAKTDEKPSTADPVAVRDMQDAKPAAGSPQPKTEPEQEPQAEDNWVEEGWGEEEN
ncbi:MAG: cytochrome c oxidase subunit II [Alphaproteobacteria bacterium]